MDIYPTISLCAVDRPIDRPAVRISNGNRTELRVFWENAMTGLYDRNTLKNVYGVEDPREYKKFLQGRIWDDKMTKVNFDDVTFDLKDWVESVRVMNTDVTEFYLYNWEKKERTLNNTKKTSKVSSQSPDVYPIYTSYRHAITRCFSLDLSIDTLPRIQGKILSGVLFTFKNIEESGIVFLYIINYPGQILRAIPLELSSKTVKTRTFELDILEVFRRRNTVHEPCNANWMEDDAKIMNDVITKRRCRPPHWKVGKEYPICNSTKEMQNVLIPAKTIGMATTYFLGKFMPPCDQILTANYDTYNDEGDPFFYLSPADQENISSVAFVFKNHHYRQIKFQKVFDIRSLLGDVGGCIGLLLGFALWQLPDAIRFLNNRYRTTVFRGEIHL